MMLLKLGLEETKGWKERATMEFMYYTPSSRWDTSTDYCQANGPLRGFVSGTCLTCPDVAWASGRLLEKGAVA
jgi:hypothetical protein